MLVSNQIASCAGNLNRIQQAMKLYALDYQGVPPVWIAENGTDANTPYDEMADPASQPVDPSTGLPTNPLMALYRTGYLKDKATFHCPADREHKDSSKPEYYFSYVWRQADSTPADQMVKFKYVNDQDSGDAWNALPDGIYLNRFKYMPNRLPVVGGAPFPWTTPPTVYTAQRELSKSMRSITVGGSQYWGPATDSSYMPADSTIITWCDYHAGSYTKNGIGQYQVLFYDGSVQMMRRTLFETGSPVGPPAAGWEVAPGDK